LYFADVVIDARYQIAKFGLVEVPGCKALQVPVEELFALA